MDGWIMTIIITLLNAGIWVLFKLNDVKHIKDNVSKIWDKLDDINKRLDKQGERIARMEGKLNGRKNQ